MRDVERNYTKLVLDERDSLLRERESLLDETRLVSQDYSASSHEDSSLLTVVNQKAGKAGA